MKKINSRPLTPYSSPENLTLSKVDKFLKETGTEIKFKFVKHGLHFQDDTETRDIWKITFKRDNKKFSIKFGQSIAEIGKTPLAYDVLACLTKYNPDTFDEFCSAFGYDTDSRKAETTYKAVVQEWEKVSGFWTEEEINKLQEIQ